MKTRNIVILFIGVILLGFTTCKKDPEPNVERFELSREDLDIGTTTVNIVGTYAYSGAIDGIKVCVFEDGVHPKEFEADINGKNFTIEMTGLRPATSYQYYYSVDYGFAKPFITETRNFTTLSELPTVKILETLAIDSTTYRVKCEVISGGGLEVTERGICWNTYGDPTLDDETLQHASGGLGQYTIKMENLALGKRYYVKAYAKNATGVGYSEEVLDFVTEAPQGTSVEIELSSNPEEGGSVSGGGTYEIGTRCTVTAVANAGYTFVNWTENGAQVSSDAQYTFDVTTGRILVANFTKQAYVVTAQVDPEDSGTVTGAGGYNYGEECTLTAAPKTGYDFEKWTKGSTTVSTDPTYTFTVTASATYVAHFKIKSYTIGVSANPTNGGSVTGGGTYNYGQSRTVKATPAEGYAFVNWTDNGDEVSTDAEYTFTVTSNRTLVANFAELQPDEYTVTVSATPSEGGTVTGGGTYQQGEQCRVIATPKAGFEFVKWTENGTQVSDEAEYTFVVTGNRVLKAHFTAQAPTNYTVSVSANPTAGGVVTGGGTYQQGQQCTVTATANGGYTFTNWTEGGTVVSTSASYNFIVNSSRTLVANFTTQSYTISASANPSSGGSVSGGGTFSYGATCTLRATANSNYVFANWTENGSPVSTSATYSFSVTGNRTLVANFTQRHTVSVSVSPSAGGTVTGGGTYNHGESCTVVATAASGYNFTNWTEGGTGVSSNANYTFTVNRNRTLVANFSVQAPNTYTINASPNPSAGGTVTGGGTYTQGQSCTVTATTNTGYNFLRWTENGNQVSTNATYQFSVSGNRTLVAQFQLKSYTIGASVNPANSGTVTGVGTYNHGQTCNLAATANTGYHFVRWTKNGAQASLDNPYSFVVTTSASYVAQFQLNSYAITASASPTNGGTVTGGGTYNYGQTCNLTAMANSGYTFDHWTKNGTTITGGATISFTVTADATYVAHFNPQSYTIMVSANPSGGGTVTGGGTYSYGQSCTVTATAASGYTFLRWTENGNQVSTNASYTFTVNSSRTLVANFITKPTVTTTDPVTNITQTSATGGGNVTNSGGATVTERGICWSTSHNPTTSGNHASSGTGTGTFTVNMTGLTAGTTYYVRAYAINSVGTAYGTEVSFTTSQIPTYTIGVSANPTNGGTVTGGGTYQQGQQCTVAATANTGYTFTNWTENGNQVSTNASYTFTVNSSRTLVANFITKPTVTTTDPVTNITQTSATGGGNVTNSGGATVTERGICWSTSHNPTISGSHTTDGTGTGSFMSSMTGLTANTTYYVRAYATNSAGTAYGAEVSFTTAQIPTYTIGVSANPSNGGTVTGGGTYQQGQSCTVSATAAAGYTFLKWTENGSQVSTNANYTFTVSGNRTLVAQFQAQSYTISVSANPTNGGTVSGGGTYTYGQSCTVHATASSGYTFTNWTANGSQVSTNANYTFTVTGSQTLMANFQQQPQAPTGAINGRFTINANGDQVYFSQGNLQYQASTDTWQFAANQYDYIGDDNSNISASYGGWIDLFGWGTSGWNCGNTYYHPWDSNIFDGDLYGPPGNNSLTGSYANADWGVYNAISNGGNQAGQWRTLTASINGEWYYVFITRNTPSGIRYAKAQVNNVNGVILLPDDWNENTYSLSNTNSSGASFSSNVISASQWSTLENAGAVFLPAAGYRNGTSVNYVGSYGFYWSASYYGSNYAYFVSFNNSNLSAAGSINRYFGLSVRLVCPAEN